MIITQDKSFGVYEYGKAAFSFSVNGSTNSDWTDLLNTSSSLSWETDPAFVQGVEIVPYGHNNDLPTEIRKLMDGNNLAPGILDREIGLLWGEGPFLYEVKIENNQVIRQWIEDKEIQSWLNSWNYKAYLQKCANEYKHLRGVYTKFYRNRGARLGAGNIVKLECVPNIDARLGWVQSRKLEDVNTIYVGDFENNANDGLTKYPVFNQLRPFASPVSMKYHSFSSYARNFYSPPGS